MIDKRKQAHNNSRTAFLQFLNKHCNGSNNKTVVIQGISYQRTQIQEIMEKAESLTDVAFNYWVFRNSYERLDLIRNNIALIDIPHFTRRITKELKEISILEICDLGRLKESEFMEIWKKKIGYDKIINILSKNYSVQFKAENPVLEKKQSRAALAFLRKKIDLHPMNKNRLHRSDRNRIKRVSTSLKFDHELPTLEGLQYMSEYRIFQNASFSKKSWEVFKTYLETNKAQLTKDEYV